MNIHQMQLSYSTQEDRIILRINSKENEEIRLFLTRRIVTSFWDILNRTIVHALTNQPKLHDMQKIPIPQNTEKEATLKQMEQQIQYQDMIENSSHETPFNNGNKFPMGEAPILIAKITINTYENNNTTLIFESDNGQNINLNLDPQLLLNLSNLLTKVMSSTDWNISSIEKNNALIYENQNKLALH
ncbi:hypothetical protein BSPLISOX_2952 [uncultured Gammaproteobacteria bacterium]|nr:hypothetical protein [uncultured Gammaproteobacteria bacterium]CAC9460759.1 hypothetical protein [uncultured Gammaproteobacteria bacterium]VVH65656.1 hypothetical protein BSPLISOX_2952 [uncultured Gammaproteobacteria bacterium]